MNKSEELIACLEGEIAERDGELAACRIAVENCELFRARIAELEARIVWLECEAQVNASPVSEAKAQGVVMPEGWIPLTIEHEPGYPEDVAFGPKRMMDRLKKWLDRYFEMRLNASPAQQVSVPAWMASSRAFADRLYMAGWRDHADAQHSGVAGMYDELLSFFPAAPAADAWIPVGERLPDSGSIVIAYYLNSYGKGRTIRAQHVEAWTIEAEDVADVDTDCVEYSEQDDCYYLLQGWYECIDNWDEYYRVAVTEGPITYWMPLPAAPIKIEANLHD